MVYCSLSIHAYQFKSSISFDYIFWKSIISFSLWMPIYRASQKKRLRKNVSVSQNKFHLRSCCYNIIIATVFTNPKWIDYIVFEDVSPNAVESWNVAVESCLRCLVWISASSHWCSKNLVKIQLFKGCLLWHHSSLVYRNIGAYPIVLNRRRS